MFPPDIAVEDILLIIALAVIVALVISTLMRRHWHRTPMYRFSFFKERKNRVKYQTALLIIITYMVVQALWLVWTLPIISTALHDFLSNDWLPVKIIGAALFSALIGWMLSALLNRSTLTEEKLHVSEERFRRIFEHSAMGILLLDERGCFMGLNRAFCQMVGYDEAELLGVHFTEITQPEDRDKCLNDMHMLIEGARDPMHLQKRYRCKNGDTIWASVVGTVVRDTQGRPLFVVGQVEDITRRKHTEEALQQSETKFRLLVEKSLVGVYIVQDAKFVYANPRLSEITGYTIDELLHLPSVMEVVDAPDWPLVQEQIRRRMAGEIISAHYSFTSVRKDGSKFGAEVHGSRIEYNGRPALLGTVLDNSQQRTAEEALRRNERMLRQIIDLVPHFIFAKDVHGRYTLVNEAVAKAYGTTVTELTGRTDADFAKSVEEARSFREFDMAVIRSGKPVLVPEEKMTTADGVIHILSTMKIPFTAGSVPAVLGVSVDITEQKNAESVLHETSGQLLKLQDEEHRRIARELHDTTAQALAALVMNLSYLQRSDTTPREKTQTVLAESVELAERCLQEIRTLSYLLHPPELDAVGLRGAVQEYATGFARRSNIQTVVEVDPNLRRLPEDAELALFRIVQEALGNILRHAQSPTARIKLKNDHHHVTLEVTDRGTGIDTERLTKINSSRGLVGVGFAGMRERLRQLGGKLAVESGSWGTTVRATVPIQKP